MEDGEGLWLRGIIGQRVSRGPKQSWDWDQDLLGFSES